jgi:tRNA G18 (ribose-2'-O)-methylase SpoU
MEPPNERAVLLNRCLDAVLHASRTATSAERGDSGTKNTTTTTTTAEPNNPNSRPSKDLMESALASLSDPSRGYDPKYGRPALRTYRSFIYPKKQTSSSSSSSSSSDALQLEAAAKRTANQIDFLVKRQAARVHDFVRNHDDPSSAHTSTSQAALDAAAATTTKFPITLVLDNLRGSFNVGSIFRTAEACGVSQILTCGITPHPNGSGAEKVAKSALGADLLVPSQHFGTTADALLFLRTANNGSNSNSNSNINNRPFVVALETTAASQLYTSVDYRPYYSKPETKNETVVDDGADSSSDGTDGDEDNTSRGRGIALILGNEVTGVDVELLEPLLRDVSGNNDNEESIESESSSSSSSSGSNESSRRANEALVDAIVELPTHGQKNSLNVAAVAPVILYEILRQWGD